MHKNHFTAFCFTTSPVTLVWQMISHTTKGGIQYGAE